MSRLATGCCVAWLLASAAAAVAAEPGPRTDDPGAAQKILAEQPPEVAEKLRRERVVLLQPGRAKGLSGSYVQALVVFSQPRRRALRLLSQTARQAEFRPELKRVETLRWTDSEAVDEHRMKIMFMKIDYRLRTHFDFEAGRIWWELDPGFDNAVRNLEGFWELYAMDEANTLGRFGTRVDVGPALPIWLQDYATRKNVPQTMENVRRWVDSNGTYRP